MARRCILSCTQARQAAHATLRIPADGAAVFLWTWRPRRIPQESVSEALERPSSRQRRSMRDASRRSRRKGGAPAACRVIVHGGALLTACSHLITGLDCESTILRERLQQTRQRHDGGVGANEMCRVRRSSMCVCCTFCQPGALRAVRSALLTQVRCEVLARFSKCLCSRNTLTTSANNGLGLNGHRQRLYNCPCISSASAKDTRPESRPSAPGRLPRTPANASVP